MEQLQEVIFSSVFQQQQIYNHYNGPESGPCKIHCLGEVVWINFAQNWIPFSNFTLLEDLPECNFHLSWIKQELGVPNPTPHLDMNYMQEVEWPGGLGSNLHSWSELKT